MKHSTHSTDYQGRVLNYKYIFLYELIYWTSFWVINNALKYVSMFLYF